jgi:hypothetical protein
MSDQNKVTADHLRRDAYLYVRQSSLYQVANNTESSRRQYDLRGRAVALGWPAERVMGSMSTRASPARRRLTARGSSGSSPTCHSARQGSCSAWSAPGSREQCRLAQAA